MAFLSTYTWGGSQNLNCRHSGEAHGFPVSPLPGWNLNFAESVHNYKLREKPPVSDQERGPPANQRVGEISLFLVSFSLSALSSLQGWPQQRCRYLKPWEKMVFGQKNQKKQPLPTTNPVQRAMGGNHPVTVSLLPFTTLPEGSPSYTEVCPVACLRLSTPVCPEEAGSQTPVVVSTWLRAFIKLAGMCTNRNEFNWIQIHREAWSAAVRGVAKSWTRLDNWTTNSKLSLNQKAYTFSWEEESFRNYHRRY